MAQPIVNELGIVGVGLIGGSLALAAKRAGLCERVVGAGRSVAKLERAVELGVIDRYEADVGAVAQADLVVVAVPLGAVEGVLGALAPRLGPETVVTDVGSAKGAVVEAARRAFGTVPPRLVPGHPIAGNERSGVDAAFAELFEGHRVVLTPTSETDGGALDLVERLWRGVGAEVERMDVERHDALLAATSHLPHMLAYALVESLARRPERDALFRFAAGGFRDFTRIASSDPVMWRDIGLANREALTAELRSLIGDLETLADALEAGDGEAVEAVFRRAKEARDAYVPPGNGADGDRR